MFYGQITLGIGTVLLAPAKANEAGSVENILSSEMLISKSPGRWRAKIRYLYSHKRSAAMSNYCRGARVDDRGVVVLRTMPRISESRYGAPGFVERWSLQLHGELVGGFVGGGFGFGGEVED